VLHGAGGKQERARRKELRLHCCSPSGGQAARTLCRSGVRRNLMRHGAIGTTFQVIAAIVSRAGGGRRLARMAVLVLHDFTRRWRAFGLRKSRIANGSAETGPTQ
ncbi:MAG TPA: hypothetical protein VEV21_14800, partial [Burkholderiales bacterium]|nr:hypothetical protein [Burkholderiales bacterium]